MSLGTWCLVLSSVGALLALALAAFRPRFRAGRFARLLQVGRLVAALSTSWAGAQVRRLFAGAEGRKRIDADQRRASAARVAETMGQMKGVFMKLGQMMSFITDDVAPEYRQALTALQASAPPMDFALVRDAAERELGRPLERAFARFDPVPLAAASIGQVHRAQLPTGEEVVVKIQYPGVAEAISGDLSNVAVLYRMMGLFFPGMEPGPMTEEVRARISEELDYALEARNQQAFHERYLGHPFIRVPRVFASHSSARVLTSEYVAGRTFAEVLDDPPEDRARWGEILYRFVFSSIWRNGAFNGDPHPGNYLFDADGRVVFLDFGCIKYFPGLMRERWRSLLVAHLAGDRAGFRALLVELSFFKADSSLDADSLYDWFGTFYEPFHQDRPFTYTREQNARTLSVVFKPTGKAAELAKQLNLPPDFVFVNRIQWGVESILAQLGASANWHRIQRELLFDDAPSTELGHLDEQHRRQPGLTHAA
jgi:predicted unusual protein kinase regulating ubiquinone biosynthesis (AarF/ABC1/UbiB family)